MNKANTPREPKTEPPYPTALGETKTLERPNTRIFTANPSKSKLHATFKKPTERKYARHRTVNASVIVMPIQPRIHRLQSHSKRKRGTNAQNSISGFNAQK
jgi:hypothetical protein